MVGTDTRLAALSSEILPEERPMGSYVTLPETWTARKARPWIERSLAYAVSLPAKKPKAAKKAR